MEIKTKFNLEDNVFFIHNNKAVDGIIKKILINVENDTFTIKYKILIDRKYKFFQEENVFKTKKELLESL